MIRASIAAMHRRALLVPRFAPALALALAVAACGGKPAPPTTPPAAAPRHAAPADAPTADDPATPFSDPTVRALLEATPAAQTECLGAGSIGDYVSGRRTELASEGTVNSNFTCHQEVEDRWQCALSVWAEHPAPDPAAAPTGSSDESAYQVIVKVHADGTFAPADIVCIAAG